MEGYRGDRPSETLSFVEDEEEEEEEEKEEEEEEEEEEEDAVDPEEAEELTNSLKDLIQSEDVKPKLQCIVSNPSFSMVTVQSEDSGITWETSSSRSSTPWASETSTTSDLYSMESSPVGSPPGKVIFIMDEGKIVRKRQHKSSNRVSTVTNLKGGQGSKKRDSSGMQRQEPRTVLGEVQGSMLNVEQVEAQDTDEEMLDDKEDVESIAEEPVKRAPIRSIFRESRLRKVGPILGGPVQARIQLFNSIFGVTEPAPETPQKMRSRRSSSVSGDSERLLETSVKERLQKFNSLSEETHSKHFQRAKSRNLETPSERRRKQRQQSTAHEKQSYSSPTTPLEKRLTDKDDASSENIKSIKMKDKPSKFSGFGDETALQHEDKKDRQSLLEVPDQVSGQSLKSFPPEEAKKQQSYSPVSKTSITEQSASISPKSGARSEKQMLLSSAETGNKKPDQILQTASDPLDEQTEKEIQSNSSPQSVSADFVKELGRQSTQPVLPTASMSEHPEREAQKSAAESHLPSPPSAKSKSTLSETRQEDITPQSSETAQSESEHMLLPDSVDEAEKQEVESHSSTAAQSETEHSDLLHSAKKMESPNTPPPETQSVHLKEQTESEEQRMKLNLPIPEKMDSKYFGISYPVHTKAQETQETSAVNKREDLDHSDFSISKTKQVESAQMEIEHPDFSYSTAEIGGSEGTQMEVEHLDFPFSEEVTEEVESAQLEVKHPESSFSREEMEECESAELETEHPDFSYSREEIEESESAKLETEYPELLFSKEETEQSESAQLQTEHSDFSYSKEETEESESIQLETEYPDFSCSREETVESQRAQLEMEHPDISFSREETEELESAQVETEHPDFSYSREETVESESAEPEMEHPDFSKEEIKELGSAQPEAEYPDFSYSTEETVESKLAQPEMEHPDFSFSREETEESENAQLKMEHQEFLFSRLETEKENPVAFEPEQPESYPHEEAEQEETAQLGAVPSDFSHLMEEAEKEDSTKLHLVHPGISNSKRRAETQQTEYQETAHSDLPRHTNETEQQELVQVDVDNSFTSHFGDKGEQPQPVQQDSQPGGKLHFHAKGVQGEDTQLQAERPALTSSTGEEQVHKTSQLRTEEPEITYYTDETEQQEILQPKLEQADLPYSHGETAQEPVQRDLGGAEPSCFISEVKQHDDVQLASENRDFSFTTGQVMQEGVESGSFGSLHLTDRAKTWEMAQSEQLLPSHSIAVSQEQETTPLNVAQPDVSFDRMGQQDRVQKGLELQETAQQKVTQMEMECSDLPETWCKDEPKIIDQIDLPQQDTAQPEVVNPSLPYSLSEDLQEEMQTKPAYPEQTFSVTTEMQEEMTQYKSEQPFISDSTGKTEQQEIVYPDLEQTFLPSSSGKEALLEMEASSEYSNLSHSFDETEQQENLKHPTLPFRFKQQETTPLVMEHPDFSCGSGEARPGNIVEQESGHPDLSYSMGETQGQSGHLDSPRTLGEAAESESMEVESKYSSLTCSDKQKKQEETSHVDSEYPDSLFSIGKAKQQATQESDYEELPKMARKRASPVTGQIESEHPDLTYSLGKANEMEMAPWETKHPHLSHCHDETNQQEVVVLDQKHRKISVGREKQQQTTKKQSEQEKLSHPPGKTEQLKYAQEDLEQPDVSFSIDRQDDKMASAEAGNADVIHPLDNTEVEWKVQRESEQKGLTCPFGKAEQHTVQPEVEIPHLAHSVGMAEPEQGYPDLPYPTFKAGGLQTAQLKPQHPGPAWSLNKVQETTHMGLEQLDVLSVHDKTVQIPPAQLDLSHTDLASPTDSLGQQGMEHTSLGHPDEGQFVSTTEHLQATKEKITSPDASSHSRKVEQREMAKPEPKHPDLSYSIDKIRTPETAERGLGKPDLSAWPGKTQQAQAAEEFAQEEQPMLLYSFRKAAQGEKAQPQLEHSQLSYSVSAAKQEAAPVKSNHSDLSAGSSEHHEIIQPEAELMNLSCSTGETQQPQMAEVDLEYPDLSHSTGTAQQQEKIQPQQEQPGDFSSALSKEEQWEGAGMQAKHPELQCSMGKTGLPHSQAESEYANLAFSASTAEPHGTTQPELKEHLLHSFVKSKPSWATPMKSEHPDISDAMAKVLRPDLSSSVSEHKKSGELEVKQERQSYTLHPEETVRLKLEQPTLSCSCGTGQQPDTATLEREFPSLYSSGKKEQQEITKPDFDHSDLSYSTDKAQQQETAQLGLGQPDGKTEHSQPAQKSVQQPELSESFSKQEEKGMDQPGFLHSLHKENQKTASPLDLVQSGLSHLLGKTEKQETAQTGDMPSDFSYSMGTAEQLQTEQLKSKSPDLSYSFSKAEMHEMKSLDLLCSYGKAQKPPTAQLEHPETSYFMGEMEQREGAQPDLQCISLQYSVVETEQPGTPSLSYPFGRTEEQGTAQPNFKESDLLSPADKAERHDTALLRAGHSEKQGTRATSSLTAQLENKQDLSFSTKEAETQPYSPLTEQTMSVSLGVSHSVSETKPVESPKSSPITGGLSPKHLDLPYTHSKTEQIETAQPASGFFFPRKGENTKNNLHLPVAAQSAAEHVTLPEKAREQTPCYFHTAMQLEFEQLQLPYSTEKAETLESQDYLTVSSKLESEPSVPFYSAEETCQQEVPPYSKPASEYLVSTHSPAEREKQTMQSHIPQSAQSECKHVIPPHDEEELQKIQLSSPKSVSLMTAQSMTLMHTQDQDEQESQDLFGTKYLSSEQLRSIPKFTSEKNKQEIKPDVQTAPRSVTSESNLTAATDWQLVSSDSSVPFHPLPEKSESVFFTGDEEKQNIPSSSSDVVGVLGTQPGVDSVIYTGGKDKCEVQPYFANQKHTSLEHLGSVSSDLISETVTHEVQHYSGEQGSLSSAGMKSISSSSDDKQNPDTASFGLASWLLEEVKSRSISPVRATEVDTQGIQPFANEVSDLGSKQIPAGRCRDLRVHGATKNKGDVLRVSDSVSSEVSHRVSSETSHRSQRYDVTGPDKVPEHEIRIEKTSEVEVMLNPEADKVPEHYLKGEEKEMKHASTVGDSQQVPEPAEQKDLFNIISEGYEILNIHAPTHISSVDQEESKHMPDKLEYLETNPSFKRKLVDDDGHRAIASGTITEASKCLELGQPATRELKEFVKNYYVEESGETQQENPMLTENNNAMLDTNNGMADVDYFEKYTLIDDKSPIKPQFERPSSLFTVTEDPNEPVEEASSFKEAAEVDTLEEEFSILENLDEVFYGTVKGESKIQSYVEAPEPLPLQKEINISSKKVEDERKSPGTPLFNTEEGVLERSRLFPTTVAAVNPELLEEPPALSFLYKDLYAEAVGEKTKDETPSDEESGNSNASFPSRNSDTDDGTGIYFEKYILKDEIPNKARGPQNNHIPENESFSGGISVQISEDKHKQGYGDVQQEVLSERGVVERGKVKLDSDIQATICKPTHAIPFGSKVMPSAATSDTTEQREEENVPVETTEELQEQSSHQVFNQLVDYQRAEYRRASNKLEEQSETTAVPEVEKYVAYVRTPVEDSEDDEYTQENLLLVPTIQQTEKPDLEKADQQPEVCEDLAESMDYDVITQEELLQDEVSSQFTHEELLFEDRDSFEHVGDSYEFVNEPEQRTPVELEDSGFLVMYPEKSATTIPQVESPQRELKKAQADTYCYNCKCPISAIDKLFGEHKDHEVTTLDEAATKMKDRLGKLLIALEEKSMKIEGFVSDIESLFNSVEENSKKNAELLEKQNEEMLKKVVAQYDEKSENFEEVKKMKMEYLYEQMVNFQQTVDSAKETLETTVKEVEELDGFVFLNSSKELHKRLLSAMDTTLSLEKVPSAFSLFEHYADSPGQSNQHSVKHVAVPQTPTVIPQEPNSATSTSIAVYWAVNDGDAIDCFQVYCMEELQASKALVEEYRVTVKESHCILEDLEPDCCYSVWVMAVNGTGCSLPSEKAIFKTAPAVPTIKAEDCTVCWDTATIRWRPSSVSAESFTLEYCRQHPPEGEGLRSFAVIKKPELKVSLEPNVNYFFYLRAVNPFGTSEQSEAALISTKGTRFHLLSDTAHPALQISSNATKICLPEKARFTGFPSVLGELLPARGCHYWEIVVSACKSYRIGISYETTSRSSVMGLTDTSWCMWCCPTQTSFLYRFLHTGVMSDVHVTEHPARIGILLDYSGGRLLFFNAERGLLLFAIRHRFTEAAHPAFALEKSGVLTLRTGMELPEFVRHSYSPASRSQGN
ncbi:cardiomyopathy-associated protein 5 isoform X2 [Apus apus]|uniref:cardiomyopathy-associated protein 5 isoform X2 n=1 Tax=Apus apus TaxID=8895 RepID=UPI0021F83F54|nr:cardiomyopathy-associated protein 5 isoform X2 [Apus apus]